MLSKKTQNNINGVLYLTKNRTSFSTNYISVREKEGRILSDENVKLLPKTNKKNKNYHEWQLRQKSTKRFVSYIKAKKGPLSILDIGCGNGWFTNTLSIISDKNSIIGLDINEYELEQASRVFKAENLEFVYGDLFQITNEYFGKFNIITLNACVQYFDDFEKLIRQLKTFLKPSGEIHIIDSCFYNPPEIESAKKRTKKYYKSVGVPEMSKNYFHHSINKISEFEIMYTPKKSIFKKILGLKDSPFMWLRFMTTFVP